MTHAWLLPPLANQVATLTGSRERQTSEELYTFKDRRELLVRIYLPFLLGSQHHFDDRTNCQKRGMCLVSLETEVCDFTAEHAADENKEVLRLQA